MPNDRENRKNRLWSDRNRKEESTSFSWQPNRRRYLKLAAVLGVGGPLAMAGGKGEETGTLIQPVSAHASDGTEILSRPQALQLSVTESEPNDSLTTATAIDRNVEVAAELTAGEIDWFAVDAPADEPLSVAFDRESDDGVSAVALYEPGGNFLDLRYVGTGTPVVLSETTTTEGTHYVQVLDVNGGTGSYTLVVKDENFSTPTDTTTPTDTPTPSPTQTPRSTPTPVSTPTAVPDDPENLWIEAESAADGTNFDPFEVHADGESSGGAYVTTPDRGRSNYDDVPSDGHAEYTFPVAVPGKYAIWARVKGQSNGNSFYVSLDDSATYEWHVDHSGEWVWTHLPFSPAALDAGTSTLTFVYREDGTKLDKLLITGDLSFVPDGTGGDVPGTPESTSTRTETVTPTDATPSTDAATPADGQSAFVSHDPSRIEAEDYDEGGDGTAYHDTDPENQGGAYRSDGVDL